MSGTIRRGLPRAPGGDLWPPAAEAPAVAAATAPPVEEAAPGQFRVLVGPWPDAGTAERSRRAVISRGYPEARMISGG